MNNCYLVDFVERLLTAFVAAGRAHVFAFYGIGLSFFNKHSLLSNYKSLHGNALT